MTTIVIRKTDAGEYRNFVCSGHAGHGFFFQKDVVCASVSVLVINTINSIEAFTDAVFTVESDENDGSMNFRIQKATKESTLLLEAMILGLEMMADNYSEYIDLKFREV